MTLTTVTKPLLPNFLGRAIVILNFVRRFRNFNRRHSALLEKYSVSLKTLLQQGISEPEFYGDLVYRFRKIVGKSNFSEQFRKLINRYKGICYSLDIMRQTACFVVYSTRRFVVCVSVCHFVLVFFSPFSIAITSFGEERANLSAFRTFVRFVLVWICRFPLPLGSEKGCGVIVALFGLFSYLFFFFFFLYEWIFNKLGMRLQISSLFTQISAHHKKMVGPFMKLFYKHCNIPLWVAPG